MAAEKDVDKVIQDELLRGLTHGVLLEVGAARPDYLSVGASFRKLGWTVISVEPNPEFCAQHRAMGYDVLQYACSDEDRDDVDFFVVDSNSAEYLDGNVSFETFSSLGINGKFAQDLQATKVKTDVKTIRVKVRKLDTILAQHHPEVDRIDAIAVDVEGWELSVMRGLSLDKYKPRVVVLENLHKSLSYRTFMWKQGYACWKRLKPNEIYVPRQPGFHPLEALRMLFPRS